MYIAPGTFQLDKKLAGEQQVINSRKHMYYHVLLDALSFNCNGCCKHQQRANLFTHVFF